MSLKVSNNSEIHKILLVSLTNIGDVVLTFPVFDILKMEFPSAKISVVIGPKAESILTGNPMIEKVHIFDKHQSPFKSLTWVNKLRKEHFDLVVDLRNTAIPAMIVPRFRTSFRNKKITNLHMREKHIDRLRSVYSFDRQSAHPNAIFIPDKEKQFVDELIEKEIGNDRWLVLVAAGAADHAKRWPEQKFAYVCDHLVKDHDMNVCFVGDEHDRNNALSINKFMEADGVNLCGRTNLIQLAELFKRSYCALVNDSAPMHIASYMDVPVLALFGPSDPFKYGPWNSHSCFIRKNDSCKGCAEPKSRAEHTCMDAITVEQCLDFFKAQIIERKIGSES